MLLKNGTEVMKRILVMVAAFACAVGLAVAAPVTSDEAAQAVKSWVGLRAQLGCRLGAAVSGTRTCVPTNGVTFHVVKLEGGGFVITSSDTETEPILAFSESDDFVESERNPLWTMLRRDLSACALRRRQVQFASAGASAPALSAPAAKWARLLPAKGTNGLSRVLHAATGKETLSDVRVAPLLQTKWNQEQDAYYSNMGDPCYNYYTPNNFPCGCVATATAQIMRYHRFPTGYVTPGTYACRVETGKDWINEWSYYPIYEDRNLTMQGGYYEWDKMPLVPADGTTLAQRQAIGKLTSDVGITCLMSYGEGGSSSGGYMAARSLPGRFGYASAVAACGGFSAAFVRKVLVSNLDAKLPVLLGVSGGSGGHAVVADGYGYSLSTFYAHFNIGWGGRNDAWYAPPNIEDYNSVDSLVYNIYPNGVENGVICSGRVLSQSGSPVAGVTVSASGTVTATVTTDANGVYAFILAPGSYVVSSGDASQSVTLVANVSTGVTDDGHYYWPPVAEVNNICDLDLTVSEVVPPQEEDPPDEPEPPEPAFGPGVWTTDVDAVKSASDSRMVVVLCANYSGCWWSQQAQPVFESKLFLDWAAANGVYLVTSDSSRIPSGCTDVTAASRWFWTLYGSVSHPDGYVYYPSIAIARSDNFNQAVGYDVVRNDGECKVGGLIYEGTADSLIAGLGHYLSHAQEEPPPDESKQLKWSLFGTDYKPQINVNRGEVAPYEVASAVYNGYLYDGDVVVGTVQVNVSKAKVNRKNGRFEAKVTAAAVFAGSTKKVSFKGGLAGETGKVTGLVASGHSLEVMLGVEELSGTCDGYRIDGARNVFNGKSVADKSAAADAARLYQGTYNVAFGDGTLSVAVDRKGKAKIAGSVDGNKVSATSQLVVGEDCATVPVVIVKKTLNLAFCLWLGADGKVELCGAVKAVAGKAGALNAAARFGIDPAEPALAALPGLLTEYLPTNVEVVRNGTKLVVAGGAKAGKLTLVKGTSEIDREKSKFTDNMSGLKLSYKAKDGTFTGSFKVYGIGSGKIKSYTATVTGVMIGARGYGTATIKNVGTMAVTIE